MDHPEACRLKDRLIDPKTPEKIGHSSEPTWLDWSENTRSYIEIMDQEIANAL